MLVLGGVFALLLRIELLTPERTIMDAMTYNRLFTLHGVVMVWLFMIPSIPTVFGNFVLPIMLGAQGPRVPAAQPRELLRLPASARSSRSAAMVAGGADTGWTFYAPYSTQLADRGGPGRARHLHPRHLVDPHRRSTSSSPRTRCAREGMRWIAHAALRLGDLRAPASSWCSRRRCSACRCCSSALDHVFRLGIFDPALGGDPVLFQHLFWFYSHPAVYIMILPAMGVISEVVSTFSRKPPGLVRAPSRSRRSGIAFVGFLTWGHHMFVAGM